MASFLMSLFRKRVDWHPVEQYDSLLLAKLPSDVFLYLLDRLPPADRAALALSCKTILLKLGEPRTLPQVFQRLLEEKEDRLSLLRRLEVHFPRHILCHQCAFFHARRKVSYLRHFQATRCDRLNGEATGLELSHCAGIPFIKAKEVMNRHRYGESYGCPITDLEFNARHIYTADLTYSSTAMKVVNGELIMRLDQSKLVLQDILKKQPPEDRPYFVANSKHGRKNWISYVFLFKEELMKEGSNSLFIRCTRCPTECRFVFDETHSPQYAETRHTSWRNLGTCNDPFDEKWQLRECPAERGDIQRISPAESLYSPHFHDDTPPSRLKEKWSPLLHGDKFVDKGPFSYATGKAELDLVRVWQGLMRDWQ